MRALLTSLVLAASLIGVEPASATRHAAFGTVPIGKQVSVKCFNAGGAVYEKNGWHLAALGSAPDNIVLAENLKDRDNSKTVVITLSGNWDCVIETL